VGRLSRSLVTILIELSELENHILCHQNSDHESNRLGNVQCGLHLRGQYVYLSRQTLCSCYIAPNPGGPHAGVSNYAHIYGFMPKYLERMGDSLKGFIVLQFTSEKLLIIYRLILDKRTEMHVGLLLKCSVFMDDFI
jgi:hypothetical protein